MNLLGRVKSWFGSEGSVRSGLGGYGELGSWFSSRPLEDGWSRNLRMDYDGARNIPAVRACVNQYAGATSQCRPSHVRTDANGRKSIILDSPQARLLRNPNEYETFNQFIFNCIAEIYYHGESFCYLIRDDRNVITQMHRLGRNSCSPYATPEGTLFYSIGETPMLAGSIEALIPSRDILHLRNFTPRHPLIGESPITAAAMAMGINVTLANSQALFFAQMSRPSGVLSTDQTLTKDQMTILREAWDAQSSSISQGKVPILGGGFKFQPMSINSQDAQLIQAQKMSTADIARVFGVPLPLIGDLEHSTMNNVESLIGLWLSTGLGALLENVEASFDKMFGFGKSDHINFDESALLRMNFKDRMDGLAKGIQGGVLTPDEARSREGLHPVPKGDKLYMQAQMQSIDTPPPVIVAPEPIVEEIPPEDKAVVYLHELRKSING